MPDRGKELHGLLVGALRDASPLNPKQFRDEAVAQGFTPRDVQMAFMLAMERGEVTFDRNMEAVEPSAENPFYEFG